MPKYMILGGNTDDDEVLFFDNIEHAKTYGTKRIYLVSHVFTKEPLEPRFEYKETKL